VVQRGDSNLHYPRTYSALDIPEGIHAEASHPRAEILARYREHTFIETLQDMHHNGSDVSDFITAFAERQGLEVGIVEELIFGSDPDGPSSDSLEGNFEVSLRLEEYPLLSSPDEFRTSNFMGSSYRPRPEEFGETLSSAFKSISLIHRLREVRAFQGFHRVKPGSTSQLVPASLGGHDDWLPACEVFGEGLFFRINRQQLSRWTKNLPGLELARIRALADRIKEQGIGYLPDPRPELVLLHGFSHIMMRQLCFECGYSASSLRERLYVDGEGMAGVLIFTADGDSEGTLGGLVRQGEPDKLPAVILRALHAASWCSGDPLCRESVNQGMAGLNRAACHACLLVSETSCELANALLDRRLLVGEDQGVRGFFATALKETGVQ